MNKPKIRIKNMVCPRCIAAVENLLKSLNIPYLSVELGMVHLQSELDDEQLSEFENSLEKAGFEILSDKKAQVVEKIKNEIIHLVHYQQEGLQESHLSKYLSDKIGQSYATFSKLFSEATGISIEKYYIQQKIEKAKELLSYQELSISEIAYQLNYSSSQHFSRQFKSITGKTPSQFIRETGSKRKPLNEI